MNNVIKYKIGEHEWVSWIKKRVDNNLNFCVVCTGETGIGKSWALISISYMIDPEFETRQVAFSFRQVMEILNSDWFKKKKYKIILFDEAQISISNREWQSLTNKLMNYLISTFRHQNVILMFTSPYSDFIDAGSRKLMHAIFEIKGHSERTKLTIIRPKLLEYNAKLRKFYEHSLFVNRFGRYNKLINWRVKKPPQHLIDPYEDAKVEFTEGLNKEIEIKLNNMSVEAKTILTTGTSKQREAKRMYVDLPEDMDHISKVKSIAKVLDIDISNVRLRLKGKEGIADLDDYIRNNKNVRNSVKK